jgi:starch synthase (maltosyl-transferring)
MPLQKIGKAGWEDYIVHDLLTGSKYVWKGEYNYVELDPYLLPFHLFLIEDL